MRSMSVGTTREAKPQPQPKDPGKIYGYYGRWEFEYDPLQTPDKSSNAKHIYQGTFKGVEYRRPLPAKALAFEQDSTVNFGVECANLGLLNSLGVGPKLLAIAGRHFHTLPGESPTIIEEDVGTSLTMLLEDNNAKHAGKPILHSPGTPERKLENQKILYDVFVQLHNAHQARIYHRDLRCENVCVRRFGEAPAEIRATIIDFDLSFNTIGGETSNDDEFKQAPLLDTVFSKAPTRIVGREVALQPNPIELDMGYLAALQYHLDCDGLVLNGNSVSPSRIDDFIEYVNTRVDYFGYRGCDAPYARHLDLTLDIDDIARALGLAPVNEETFASSQLLSYAQTFHKPYLDAEDMQICTNGPEARFAEMIDKIVADKYEVYKARRRAEGKHVYEKYTDQPLDLQRSNYAQAEHLPEKVRALGYQLAFAYDSQAFEEVTSFDREQIEVLARLEHERWMDERLSAGWTLDRRQKDSVPEKKLSPYLIDYEELPEKIKEYDRDTARELISLVQSVGLMVVRPRL